MGILGMAPLTALIFLPLFRPSSMHFSNLAGFHFASGVTGSPTLIIAWIFVMTWSVLGVEAAACYVGECRNPSRDAKIAMTAEGLYGFFIFVMTAVVLVLVLGVGHQRRPADHLLDVHQQDHRFLRRVGAMGDRPAVDPGTAAVGAQRDHGLRPVAVPDRRGTA